jgi:hypothetical protein
MNSACSRLSMAQGPAISENGKWFPKETEPAETMAGMLCALVIDLYTPFAASSQSDLRANAARNGA